MHGPQYTRAGGNAADLESIARSLAAWHSHTAWSYGPMHRRWRPLGNRRFLERRLANDLASYRPLNPAGGDRLAAWIDRNVLRTWRGKPRLGHGDSNFSNMVMASEGPCWIDLSAAAFQSPAEDLARLYGTALHTSPQLWNCFLDGYFAAQPQEARRAVIADFPVSLVQHFLRAARFVSLAATETTSAARWAESWWPRIEALLEAAEARAPTETLLREPNAGFRRVA